MNLCKTELTLKCICLNAGMQNVAAGRLESKLFFKFPHCGCFLRLLLLHVVLWTWENWEPQAAKLKSTTVAAAKDIRSLNQTGLICYIKVFQYFPVRVPSSSDSHGSTVQLYKHLQLLSQFPFPSFLLKRSLYLFQEDHLF